MIISPNHLTDKHQIYWALKYITSQTFLDIDYLVNYIGLKLLQPLQDSVHFLHSLFCILINAFDNCTTK